jgi:hypothetical protein
MLQIPSTSLTGNARGGIWGSGDSLRIRTAKSPGVLANRTSLNSKAVLGCSQILEPRGGNERPYVP